MSSLSRRPNSHYWIFYSHNERRHTLRLGAIGESDAQDIQRRLDRLIGFRRLGVEPDPATADWLSKLGVRLHKCLVTAGLATGRGPSTLGDLIERHELRIVTRQVKPSTLVNTRVLYGNLRSYFTAQRRLSAISIEDADAFRFFLLDRGGKNGGKLAASTVSNRCRRTRTIFTMAVKAGWLSANPFEHMGAGNETNPERDRYIPVELFTKIVNATTDKELRLLLALVRFCGLRCPSELQPLTWAAIDWAVNILVVASPKTERYEGQDRREVPLFEPVLPYLHEWWDADTDKPPLIFPRHQGTGASITGRLETLCRKVGEPLWPKPFVNMRASAEHDLLSQGHNINHVAAWFGHSPEVALKHYSRVVKERQARDAAGRASRHSVGDLPAVESAGPYESAADSGGPF